MVRVCQEMTASGQVFLQFYVDHFGHWTFLHLLGLHLCESSFCLFGLFFFIVINHKIRVKKQKKTLIHLIVLQCFCVALVKLIVLLNYLLYKYNILK